MPNTSATSAAARLAEHVEHDDQEQGADRRIGQDRVERDGRATSR